MAQAMPATKAFILLLVASTASADAQVLAEQMQETPVHLPMSEERLRNCDDVMTKGGAQFTEYYTIYPYDCCPDRPLEVKCDLMTDGGGWTVIQHRGHYATQEDFYRTWVEYGLGFGSIMKDHWLGLENIHALTAQGLNELRIDMEDFEGEKRFARYKTIHVSDRASSYSIQVGEYSGDAGDALSDHNNCKFSTKDKDNDERSGTQCAQKRKGAWWYSYCGYSNLNGQYLKGAYDAGQYLKGLHAAREKGVNWDKWRGKFYSLKTTTMMIRPAYGRHQKGSDEL